jgi:hypothetical protein
MEAREEFFLAVSSMATSLVESRTDGDTPDNMPETLTLLRYE